MDLHCWFYFLALTFEYTFHRFRDIFKRKENTWFHIYRILCLLCSIINNYFLPICLYLLSSASSVVGTVLFRFQFRTESVTNIICQQLKPNSKLTTVLKAIYVKVIYYYYYYYCHRHKYSIFDFDILTLILPYYIKYVFTCVLVGCHVLLIC